MDSKPLCHQGCPHNYCYYVPGLVLISALHALFNFHNCNGEVGTSIAVLCESQQRQEKANWLIGLNTEQSQESSWGGCDSQAPALCSLPYLNSQSDLGKLCLAEAECYNFCMGPAHGALGCCFPSEPTRCIFLLPQPGPGSDSFGQDGACLLKSRCQSQGQSDRSEFSSAYWKP